MKFRYKIFEKPVCCAERSKQWKMLSNIHFNSGDRYRGIKCQLNAIYWMDKHIEDLIKERKGQCQKTKQVLV